MCLQMNQVYLAEPKTDSEAVDCSWNVVWVAAETRVSQSISAGHRLRDADCIVN